MGNWAFSWVQIMAHNKAKLLFVWAIITVFIFAGIMDLDFSPLLTDFSVLMASLVVMSGVVGYLLESAKVALLQFVLSVYIVLMTLGALGWLGYGLTQESLLGLVVLMTVMSSNLVHVLSTLLREMARGLFQYDAIAEALKINASPVFLSNLTTALGFVFAAWLDSSYIALAWLAVVGVLFSFLITISWLPMVLLNWLLEFRVGNSKDRHGLNFLVTWFKENPRYRQGVVLLGVGLSIGLTVFNWAVLSQLEQLFWLVSVFLLLFWMFWQSLRLALMNVAVNFMALLASISLFTLINNESEWAFWLWMIPLGLIVDDGIHFFSRISRARNTVFSDPESSVIYAMSSVARPIWVTSWVLFFGLAVLLLSSTNVVYQASLLTMIALVVATFVVLTVLPALLMTERKK